MFNLITEVLIWVFLPLFVGSLFLAYFIYCISEEKAYRGWKGFKK